MEKCTECSGIMKELKSKTPEGVEYLYHQCTRCGEEIVDMRQLHAVADIFKKNKEKSK